MDTFRLKVDGFHRVFFDGPALELQLPTLDGSRGILAHHENAVVGIIPGTLRICKEDGTWITAVTYMGFARITGEEVSVMIEKIYLPEEIDERKTQENLERAREQLRQKHSMLEHQHVEAKIARSLARLQVKNINM